MILIRTIRRRMRSYTNYLYYWKRWRDRDIQPQSVEQVGSLSRALNTVTTADT